MVVIKSWKKSKQIVRKNILMCYLLKDCLVERRNTIRKSTQLIIPEKNKSSQKAVFIQNTKHQR